jgi:hypothetical protein
MTKKPIPGTHIRTDSDLCKLWQDMMGSGGFARRSLWMIFLDDENLVQPLVVPIDDIPAEPELDLLGGLGNVLESLVDGEMSSSVALLLSRPGFGRTSEQDRRWARALHSELGSRITLWPVPRYPRPCSGLCDGRPAPRVGASSRWSAWSLAPLLLARPWRKRHHLPEVCASHVVGVMPDSLSRNFSTFWVGVLGSASTMSM